MEQVQNATLKKDNIALKIYRFIKNNNLLLSFLINIVFVLGYVLIFFCYFETNDDVGMSSIAYGYYGEYSSYLVFENFIIGSIIKFLASIFISLPVYSIIMYGMVFIAFWMITFIFLKLNTKAGFLLTIIMLLFFGYNIYVKMQFTKAASVITIAGLLLLYFSIKFNDKKYALLIIGYVLIVFGASYRFGMSYVCVVCMSALFFYLLITEKNKRKKLIISCIIVVAMLCVLYLSNKLIIASDYGMDYFSQFNTLRAELMDHGWPDYEGNSELYQYLNIYSEDLDMFKSWDFADPDIFNLDSAATLCEAKDTSLNISEIFAELFSWFPFKFIDYTWIWAVLIVTIVALFTKIRSGILLAYNLFILVAINLYFTLTARYLLERVDVGIFLCFFVVISFWILNQELKNAGTKYVVCGAIVAVVFCMPVFTREYKDNKQKEKTAQEENELSNLISNDKENLYLISTVAENYWGTEYSVWKRHDAGKYSNMYGLGGWGTYLPSIESIKTRYGFQNPFSDCVDNDNIYICPRSAKVYGEYVKRHYCDTVVLCPVKIIGDDVIYKACSEEYKANIEKELEPNESIKGNVVIGNDEYLTISAYMYMEGVSSFNGKGYARITDWDGNQSDYFLIQYETDDDSCVDDQNGKYSKYCLGKKILSSDVMSIEIIYENEGVFYSFTDE